jgi:hypothetical protein
MTAIVSPFFPALKRIDRAGRHPRLGKRFYSKGDAFSVGERRWLLEGTVDEEGGDLWLAKPLRSRGRPRWLWAMRDATVAKGKAVLESSCTRRNRDSWASHGLAASI